MQKILFLSSFLIVCILNTVVQAQSGVHLAGYWKLDETQVHSTSALDESGTSNGIVHGEVTFLVNGVNDSSTAAKFVGSGRHIEIPHHDDYLIDSGTVVFWVQPENFDGRYGLWSKDSTDFDTGGHLSILLESNRKIRARIQSTTTSYTLYSTTELQADAWTHIAVVFGVGGFELYINGVLEDSDLYEGGLGTSSGGIGNYEPLVLGANSWGSADLNDTPVSEYFPGVLDEVGLISERWDSETIGDLYTQTGPGTTGSLGEFAEPPVFYVRTRGSDADDGLTPQTSFRTIQHAIDRCTRAGTTVYVGAGVYREGLSIGIDADDQTVDGTDALPIQIIADLSGAYTFDDPGAVVIDGQSVQAIGINLFGRVHWVFDGFSFQSQTNYNVRAINAGIDLINCHFKVPAIYAVYITAHGDVAVENCVFERAIDSRHCIWVTPNNSDSPTEVLITGNDLSLKGEHYLSTGLQNGIQSIPRDSWGSVFTYGIVVFGWNSSQLSSVRVTNNQVSDCYLGIFVGSYGASAHESVVANNTVVGCFYSMYSFARNTISVRVMNNIIDRSYFGLMSYSYDGSEVEVIGLLEHRITRNMAAYLRPFEFDIVAGSPRFTDASAGDFSLRLGSPAIDAGITANAPSTDIAGNSRPSDGDGDGIAGIDLGAYELVTMPIKIRIVKWKEIGAESNR